MTIYQSFPKFGSKKFLKFKNKAPRSAMHNYLLKKNVLINLGLYH